MIKRNKWILFVTSLVTLLPLAVGLILWNRLPEQMPTWPLTTTISPALGSPKLVIF